MSAIFEHTSQPEPAPDPDEPLRRVREQLRALVAGSPVLLDSVDLVALSNLPYDGLDPDEDPNSISAAAYALDVYLYKVGDQRAVGGVRARGLHYELCRYVLPFLLEHRAGDNPISAGAWRINDITAFAQMLAGERALPAATVAADQLNRLGVMCHWLTWRDAATVCHDNAAGLLRAINAGELTVFTTADGESVVRASDLRIAGLLREPTTPHGLSRDSADHSLRHLQRTWAWAVNQGAQMVGDPKGIKAKKPLPGHRRNDPKPTARAYASIERCLQLAAHLHPVHQSVLWQTRLASLRSGEVFGWSLSDRQGAVLQVESIGGAPRDVRGPDGKFARAERRAGTKGSDEGEVQPGVRGHGRGLRRRTVRLPDALVEFLDTFDTVFHTDPVSGAKDPGARALPGLRDEGSSGMHTFTSALKAACLEAAPGEEPITPHDLRASLNTDLENRRLDGRLLRHFLGHETENGRDLDVHARHYDLGLDDAALAVVANAIQQLLPAGVDLKVPTCRTPHFGPNTPQGERSARIESDLLKLGWFTPGQVSGQRDPAQRDEPRREVTTQVAAELLALSTTQVKRLLHDGRLQGRLVGEGSGTRWLIDEDSLQHYKATRERVTLADLARDLGVPYSRMWSLARKLGLTGTAGSGQRIELDDTRVAALTAAVQDHADNLAHSMTYSEAAKALGVTEPLIQTFVRNGTLEAAPRDGRQARVTRRSVQGYRERYPFTQVSPGEKVVSVAEVRRVLGLTRPAVSDLIRRRQLSVKEIQRRQFVGSDSVRAYLGAAPSADALELLALVEMEQP